jgi:hypothetical protein
MSSTLKKILSSHTNPCLQETLKFMLEDIFPTKKAVHHRASSQIISLHAKRKAFERKEKKELSAPSKPSVFQDILLLSS